MTSNLDQLYNPENGHPCLYGCTGQTVSGEACSFKLGSGVSGEHGNRHRLIEAEETLIAKVLIPQAAESLGKLEVEESQAIAGVTPSLPNSTRQRLKRSIRQVFGEPVRGKAVQIPEEGRRESRGCSPRNIAPLLGHLTDWVRHLIPQRIEKRSLPLTATPSGLRGFLLQGFSPTS